MVAIRNRSRGDLEDFRKIKQFSTARGRSILVPPQTLFQGGRRVAADAASADPIEQVMERLPQGARRLAAQVRTNLPLEVLWSVLTDYRNLSSFIPNLSSSELVDRDGPTVRLKQVGTQQLLGLRFSAQVQLQLTEYRPEGLLRFHMLQGDFRRFEGSWQMHELPEGSSLIYELTVQGCLGMPIALIEERLRHDLSSNLNAVVTEARKRQQVSEAG